MGNWYEQKTLLRKGINLSPEKTQNQHTKKQSSEMVGIPFFCLNLTEHLIFEVACFNEDLDRAQKICEDSQDQAACYHLARPGLREEQSYSSPP